MTFEKTKTNKMPGTVSAKLPIELSEFVGNETTEKNISISEVVIRALKELKEKKEARLEDIETTSQSAPEESPIIELGSPSIDPAPLLSEEQKNELIEELRQQIELSLSKDRVMAPEREYLKRIIGRSFDQSIMLTKEEEQYLKQLTLAVKADVTESLLHEHKSVPIVFENKLQQQLFEKMVDVRNSLVDNKRPNFQTLFQKAIFKAFIDDCSSLYSRNLFKVTYGFTYSEFQAVFSESDL